MSEISKVYVKRIPKKVRCCSLKDATNVIGEMSPVGLTAHNEYAVIGLVITEYKNMPFICYLIMDDEKKAVLKWAHFFEIIEEGGWQ